VKEREKRLVYDENSRKQSIGCCACVGAYNRKQQTTNNKQKDNKQTKNIKQNSVN
jgi:hypothetical protein